MPELRVRACRAGATLQPASRPPGGGAGDIQHCPGRAHRPPGRGTSAPSVHVFLRPACRRQVPEQVERRTVTQNMSLASRQRERRLQGSLLCGPSFTQPPGPCGTHTRCPARGRLGAAKANLARPLGPPGRGVGETRGASRREDGSPCETPAPNGVPLLLHDTRR